MLRRLTQRDPLAAGLFPLFFTSVPALDSLMDGVITSKRLYFYGACALLFIVVSAHLVVRKRETKLEFNALDAAIIALWLWALIRAAFTEYLVWHDDGLITITLLLFVYLVIRNVIAAERRVGGTRIFSILAIGLITGALIQSAYGMLQLYGLDPFPTNNYFKLIGSFGNPDALAGYLASIMPFALGMYLLIPPNNAELEYVRTMGLITFCGILLALPATMIRGAWLGAGVGSLLVVGVKYDITRRLRPLLSTRIKRIAATIMLLTCVAGMTCGLYSMKRDSADGRLLIWKITLNIIKDHPLWGIGFDRFAVEYGHYQAAYFASGEGTPREEYLAGNVHHAHNEVLQLIAELGLIGGILLIGIGVLTLRLPAQEVACSTAAQASLAALFVAALFSFSFHILPQGLNAMALLAIISACCPKSVFVPVMEQSSFRAMSVVSCSALALTLASKTYLDVSGLRIWQDGFHKFVHGDFVGALERYASLEHSLAHHGKFWFMYAGALVKMGDWENALRVLKISERRFTDPNLWLLYGFCFESTREPLGAELNYRYADHIVPSRLLPKYYLARLFAKHQRLEDARKMACRVLQMKEKNPGTISGEQIKSYMQRILRFADSVQSTHQPTTTYPRR